MSEEWRDIQDFEGYQVSDNGRVRTFWHKHRCPTGHGTYCELSDIPRIVPQSDDGNGYLKVTIRNHTTNRSFCKKVHRLVAEAFIKHDVNDDTVDHILSGTEGKLDNSVDNLRWISRRENIKKAYRDGMCDERIVRQNKAIIATDLWTGDELYFDSIKEAADRLGLDRSYISHVLIGDNEKTSHYTFEYAGREEKLLYGNQCY